MGDLVAEFKDAAVFGRLPDDMSISERVTQNQSLLVAGLRDALADIATLTIKVEDLQRQLANVTSTPQHLKAASLPPTPATLLMPSPRFNGLVIVVLQCTLCHARSKIGRVLHRTFGSDCRYPASAAAYTAGHTSSCPSPRTGGDRRQEAEDDFGGNVPDTW